MAILKSRDSSNERAKIRDALNVFFAYLDQREAIDDMPPEVQRASNTIVVYYTECLKKVLRMLPMGRYLPRIVDAEDVYQHAWAALWLHGRTIKNRSVGGVYQWLKTVVIHRVTDLCRKHSKKVPWEYFIEVEWKEPEILEDFLADDDGRRYALICGFVEQAISMLGARGRELIQLIRAEYTLAEIAKRMNLPSPNAVSSFKRRTFRKIKTLLLLLFQRALNDPKVDRDTKEIIVELLERFNQRGGEPPCLFATT